MRWILALMAFLSASVWADGNWYAGASLGEGKAQGACSKAPSHAMYSCDEHDTVYGLFIGRQFTKAVAVELGVVDLGQTEILGQVEMKHGKRIMPRSPFPNQVLYPARATWEAKGVELVGLFSRPVSEQVSVFVRGGGFWWDAKYRSDIPVVPASYDKSGLSATIGVGLNLQASKQLGIRAQWQRYNAVDGANVNVVGAAATWAF